MLWHSLSLFWTVSVRFDVTLLFESLVNQQEHIYSTGSGIAPPWIYSYGLVTITTLWEDLLGAKLALKKALWFFFSLAGVVAGKDKRTRHLLQPDLSSAYRSILARRLRASLTPSPTAHTRGSTVATQRCLCLWTLRICLHFGPLGEDVGDVPFSPLFCPTFTVTVWLGQRDWYLFL